MLYQMSMVFDEQNEYIANELNYISKVSKREIEWYSFDDIHAKFIKEGISFGADQDIEQLIWSFANTCLEQKYIPEAKLCFQIFYDLTQNDDAKKIIDSLPDNAEEE